MATTDPLSREHRDAFSKAIERRRKSRIKASKKRIEQNNKIAQQWGSGQLSGKNATKAKEKVEWYTKDAFAKADQAYDKAITAAEAKQAKLQAETAKGWGRLDPKKKTEKKRTGGVTGSRSFVRRNY